MSNIGIFCPPLTGHLNPIAVLGRALISRGHRVTVFQFDEFRRQVTSEGLEFCALGHQDESLSKRILEMGNAQDLKSLKLAVEGARQSTENICLHAPDALKKNNIDLVLADQNEPGAGTAAEHLGLPFVSLCPSLPLNREPGIPPPFVGWSYTRSPWGLFRNAVGIRAADLLIGPINNTLNRFRAKWKLPALRGPDDSFSKLAQLSQMTQDFDFPRHRLPDTFHYLGPWLDAKQPEPVEFPYARLDGRPFVYASFGTLQPGAAKQFEKIADACHRLNLQLVLAAGKAAEALGKLPGNPIVVSYAPQLELLPKCALAVTHGGMNTVMQALRFGKPMLAIPQTHDQPGIAARLAFTGAGLVLTDKQPDVSSIEQGLKEIRASSLFTEAAQRLRGSIELAGGTQAGVAKIERVLELFDRYML